MKKIYSIIMKAAAALMLAFAPLAASAELTPIADGETAQCDVQYVFTAPADGSLMITALNEASVLQEMLFSSPTFEMAYAIYPYSTLYTSRGYQYYFKITEGENYYFYFDAPAAVGEKSPTFVFQVIEGSLPNNISFIDPVPNTQTPYNLATYPKIFISFLNQGQLSCQGDAATLVYTTVDGGTATTPIYYEGVMHGSSLMYELALQEAIRGVKKNMKDRTEFSVLLTKPTVGGEPVTGKYVNAEGNIELEYFYVAQTSIEEAVYPDPFLSFWPEDSQDGVLSFTFDGPLAPMDEQKNLSFHIFAGPYRDGGDDFGWPQVPAAPLEISGNNISADLRGVHRITTESTVTIYIAGLVDASGMSIDYNGNGAIMLMLPYTLIPQVDLEYEFTPADGSLADVSNVELWAGGMCFEHVSIDGFTFTAQGFEPVEVKLADTNPTPTPLNPNNIIYTIPVPDVMKTAPGVKLAAVLTSIDGYTYSMEAMYNVTDGVEAIEADGANDAEWFDLQGRRVTNPERGIYIRDGKKVIL